MTLDGYSDNNPDTGSIAVYLLNDSDGDDYVDDGELTALSEAAAKTAGAWPTKPDGTEMSFVEARQNFANYYSFYRRRELAAKAVVAQTIESMQGVNIGLFSIQERVKEPAVPVDVEGLTDQTAYLLNVLYSEYWSSGDTPLRSALLKVGQYYHQDDGYTGGITSNTSPYYAEEDGGGCQKAFAVLMTDGYYNGNLQASVVGKNFNPDGDDNTEFDGGEFADDETRSLADVAMYYYENDIAQSLSDFVPPTGFDTARQQHMVTYTVAFGVHGSIDPAAWPNCPPDCDPSDEGCDFDCPEWPDLDSDEEKIDDLWHAAVNGRGLFLSADNPTELRDALMRIKEDIEKKTRSGAAVSVNAQELSSDTVLYQAIYNTDGWQGDLRSKCLDQNTGDIVDCTGGLSFENEDTLVAWSANRQLENRATTTDSVTGDVVPNRQIITYVEGLGQAFNYASLSESQKESLLGAPETTSDDTLRLRRIVNYLRGSSTNEASNGGSFRNRKAMFGDFVHSAPTLVTGVGTNDDESLIIVGGNDGMLHIFNADNGEEVCAYVPNMVFENLSDLTDPYYTHKFFVDNTAFSAKVNGRTLVVGTLGKGGKGVYCLDVTGGATGLAASAETDAASIVKWEYPGAAAVGPDSDLGYGFSRAYLVDSNAGPVVILGNGYQSTNGRAILYILDAADGTLLRKIDTLVGDPLNLNTTGVGDSTNYNCNGLSTPALVDTDLDGAVDYAYAGDLLGNLWKFDLTDSDAANWHVSYNTSATGTGTPQPLFQAVNAQNQRQPITSRPDVMMPCGAFQSGYMVVFSTGRYLGTDDLADTTVQSVYAVWDWQEAWEAAGVSGDDKYLGHFEQPDANGIRTFSNMANIAGALDAEKVTLQQQTLDYYDAVEGLRVLSNNSVEWTEVPPAPLEVEHMGWYFDFPGSRERGVQDITITGGYVILITNLPDSSPCSSAGTSFMHVLNACTGGRMTYPTIDLNGDGVLDSADLVNVGSDANPSWVAPSGFKGSGMWYTPAIISLLDKSGDLAFSSTSEGTIEKVKLMADPVGMYYWREIN